MAPRIIPIPLFGKRHRKLQHPEASSTVILVTWIAPEQVLELVASDSLTEKNKENRIGQGRENAKIYLRDNPEILEEIDALVRDHYGINGEVTSKDEAEDVHQPKKSRKSAVVNDENEDILIIPSDAYLSENSDDEF